MNCLRVACIYLITLLWQFGLQGQIYYISAKGFFKKLSANLAIIFLSNIVNALKCNGSG